MTSRIIVEENVTRKTEAVAPNINITWNPLDNTGSVDFYVQQQIYVDGVFRKFESETRSEFVPMRFDLQNIMGRVAHVPVGQDVDGNVVYKDVPGLLLMAAIKQFFDDLYTERVIHGEEAVAQAELEAAQQAALGVPDAAIII